ncbi:putative HXXXD-type acyl-transferase family protein [Hibiscus syriacus]|uniref:HXXXD-type acyl-transferase family protein n=1 Tax=Hibiscus syriacus TaxID=106335 RepID=A0A6A3ABJ6_HIBSY|nr:putative HXXXD-type acyl-transferase family protein [Hibiscus syriacus]
MVVNDGYSYHTADSAVMDSSFKCLKVFTHKKVNMVLDEINFLLQKQQILLTVQSHRLNRLLVGVMTPLLEMIVSSDGDVVSNDAYEDYVAQDSALASWLLSTISSHLLSQFAGETARLFGSLKEGNDTTIVYLTCVKEVCDALASCGSAISSKEHVASNLKGLQCEYQSLMVFITTMRESLSLESICTMFVDAETQLDGFDDQVEMLPISANIAQWKDMSSGCGLYSHYKEDVVAVQYSAYEGGCSGYNSTLSLKLTPFFDRSVLKGLDGLNMLYLDQWLAISESNSNKKSLKIMRSIGEGEAMDLVHATFEITRDDLNKLRERVLSEVADSGKGLHLSTFVLTYVYVTTCMVKARGGDGDRRVLLRFTVDCKSQLNPPVPENYFCNCNRGILQVTKARDFLGEQRQIEESEIQAISVVGSPRFGVYGSDFGWGKPHKVVIISSDKNRAFSMAESRHGSGGVEVDLALKKHEMDTFSSLFLKHV